MHKTAFISLFAKGSAKFCEIPFGDNGKPVSGHRIDPFHWRNSDDSGKGYRGNPTAKINRTPCFVRVVQYSIKVKGVTKP